MASEVTTHAKFVESRAAKTIREAFESGRPLTYIRSSEEQRVANVLAEVSRAMSSSAPLPVWTWSLTEGLSPDDGKEKARDLDPRGVLDFIAAHNEPAIFHLKDFHEPLRDSASVRRRLRDLYRICLDKQKFIVITSPLRSLPEEERREAFFHCWTRKEAVLKAVGTGLAFPLDKVVVTLARGEPARVIAYDDDPGAPLQWWLECLAPMPEYIGALAAVGTPLEVQCWRADRFEK